MLSQKKNIFWKETPTKAYAIKAAIKMTVSMLLSANFSLHVFSKSWQLFFNVKRGSVLVNLADTPQLVCNFIWIKLSWIDYGVYMKTFQSNLAVNPIINIISLHVSLAYENE